MDYLTLEPTNNYIQHEQWFEITKQVNLRDRDKSYILVVNSYGRVRKLFRTGGYEDVHDGGPVIREDES